MQVAGTGNRAGRMTERGIVTPNEVDSNKDDCLSMIGLSLLARGTQVLLTWYIQKHILAKFAASTSASAKSSDRLTRLG